MQFILGIGENVFAIILVSLNADMIDEVIAMNSTAFLRILPKLLFFFVAQILCLHYKNVFAAKTKCNYGCRMRKDIYKATMNYEGNENRKAAVLNIFNTYIGQLQSFVEQIANVGVFFCTIFVASFYMIKINTALFVASVILIPLFSWLLNRINIPLQLKNKIIMKDKEQINHDIKEILEGFHIIKAYRLEKKFQKRFRNDTEKLKKNEKEKYTVNAWISRIGIVLVYVPHLIVPLFGGWLCMRGNITVGEVAAANIIVWYITSPLNEIIAFFKTKKTMVPIVDEINGFIKDAGTPLEESGIILERGELDIKDLSFSYDRKNMVLNHVNMTIGAGEHVVVMGESGAGKSTLIRILCAMESDFSGSVRMNDTMVLGTKNRMLWRNQIAYVSQEPYVYSLSIRENICMGKDIPDDKFERIIKISGVKEFACDLTDGLDTKVGDGGVKLSGGQIKKMAIARMLVQEVPVYILDEPLSALDSESAKSIQENLSEYLKEKTVILVSHQKLAFWKKTFRYIELMKG